MEATSIRGKVIDHEGDSLLLDILLTRKSLKNFLEAGTRTGITKNKLDETKNTNFSKYL